jgi:hypothetical protein
MRLDVFGVGDAADHAERRDELVVERNQPFGIVGVAIDGAGREDSALMHDLHRRFAVAVHFGEDHVAFAGDGVDMEDVAGDEAFEEEIALLVAELIESAPEALRFMDFADADGRGFGARLEHPWRRHAVHVGAQVVVVENSDELRYENAGAFRLVPHRELVAKIGGGG